MNIQPRFVAGLDHLCAVVIGGIGLLSWGFLVRIEDSLEFRASTGMTLKREIGIQETLSLESMMMDGQDIDTSDIPDTGDSQREERLLIQDRFEADSLGRPVRVHRSFLEVTGRETADAGSAEDGEGDQQLTSPLKGASVIFSWDDTSRALECTPSPGTELDRAILESLEEDIDYRWVLPPDVVLPGQQWTAAVGVNILKPGGDTWLGLDAGEMSHQEVDLARQLRINANTRAKMRFVNATEENGERLGYISIRAEVGSFMVWTPDFDDGQMTQRLEHEATMEGMAIWNITLGHLQSLTLKGVQRKTATLRFIRREGEEGEEHEQVTVEKGDVEMSVYVKSGA